MDGVHFDLGKTGRVQIGDFCYFTNAVLLCELELHIGNYVVIGWNTTITDTDFHPISPAERVADASGFDAAHHGDLTGLRTRRFDQVAVPEDPQPGDLLRCLTSEIEPGP